MGEGSAKLNGGNGRSLHSLVENVLIEGCEVDWELGYGSQLGKAGNKSFFFFFFYLSSNFDVCVPDLHFLVVSAKEMYG